MFSINNGTFEGFEGKIEVKSKFIGYVHKNMRKIVKTHSYIVEEVSTLQMVNNVFIILKLVSSRTLMFVRKHQLILTVDYDCLIVRMKTKHANYFLSTVTSHEGFMVHKLYIPFYATLYW